LCAAAIQPGCLSINSRNYKSEIAGTKAVISFDSLNGKRRETIVLKEPAALLNVDANCGSGVLEVIVASPDGAALAQFTLREKESTKIERLGPYPQGPYAVHLVAQSATNARITIVFW
jgi:hypothetical protein